MCDVMSDEGGCRRRRQQKKKENKIESTLGLSSAKALIYWLVFRNMRAEMLNACECRLTSFVCANNINTVITYLGWMISLRFRIRTRESSHKHHQFKSTTEYQSGNKYRARVANRASLVLSSSSSNYLYNSELLNLGFAFRTQSSIYFADLILSFFFFFIFSRCHRHFTPASILFDKLEKWF